MSYSKFFTQNKKFALMLLDFKCAICAVKSRSNHVHHIDFNSKNDNFDNYTILCPDCHKLVHTINIKLAIEHPPEIVKKWEILIKL